MNNTLRKFASGLMLASVLSFAALAVSTNTGCSSKAVLDPAGVYHGDKFVADSEQVIASSYDVISAFLKWETANRPLLASQPQITKAADKIRTDAPRWFQSAHALLDAYKSAPTPANKVNAQQALAIITAALTEVAAYMAVPLPPSPPPAH